MILDTIKDIILQNIGPLKPAPKNYRKRNCFMCHTMGHGLDKRGRFGIQFGATTIVAHCFNCSFKAIYEEGKGLSKSFEAMLLELGVPQNTIKDLKLVIFKLTASGNSAPDDAKTTIILDNIQYTIWPEMKMPASMMSIREWIEAGVEDERLTAAAEYLVNRRIYDFDKFYWTCEDKGNLSDRVILPYYYQGKTVGYAARLTKDLPGKAIPKYIQRCPENFVYNLDPQERWDRKVVIVTEGVIDAYVVDGVGVLGEINKEKIGKISRLQKRIIVMPDRDKKGYDLVETAIRNNWEVSFPKWDSTIKDAAAASEVYGRLLTVHSIIEAACDNRSKIELKWKIESDERSKRARSKGGK